MGPGNMAMARQHPRQLHLFLVTTQRRQHKTWSLFFGTRDDSAHRRVRQPAKDVPVGVSCLAAPLSPTHIHTHAPLKI